ncbi:mediator complex, subunit Med5 [Limtongia smithiae]|uniref:mediator complex, subunit Med5 n=1 Tax=Limtongia smithiae TaxID=1125753 RepID=UPI0034CE5118
MDVLDGSGDDDDDMLLDVDLSGVDDIHLDGVDQVTAVAAAATAAGAQVDPVNEHSHIDDGNEVSMAGMGAQEDQEDAAAAQATELLRTCLRRRVPADQFAKYMREAVARTNVPSPVLCRSVVHPLFTTFPDPLHLQYLAALCTNSASSQPLPQLLPGLLASLLACDLEFRVEALLALTHVVSPEASRRPTTTASSTTPATAAAATELAAVLAVYIAIVITSNETTGVQDDAVSSEAARDIVAQFLIALSSNTTFRNAYTSTVHKDKSSWDDYLTALGQLISYLYVTNLPLAQKLEASTKQWRASASQFTPTPAPQNSQIGAIVDSGSEQKLPWMEEMLSGRRPRFGSPKFTALFSGVFRTHSADAAIALVVAAAFDALSACAMAQDATRVALWKTFIVNRLPLLLCDALVSPPADGDSGAPTVVVRSLVPTATVEYALRRPLLMINENALAIVNAASENDIDVMFATSGSQSAPYDMRYEFLKALASVGVIESAAVDRVLGGGKEGGEGYELNGGKQDSGLASVDEMTSALVDAYDFEAAVKQFISDVDGLGCLRQSAAIDAIVGLLATWPAQRETYKLRILAQEIALNTTTMNIMLVYRDPYEILLPLVECLDRWTYEDESNFQDNYTDFGVILLLICSFYYHFNLELSEFSEQQLSVTSFCRKYLTSNGTAHPIELLTPDLSDLLGGWIMGLYDTNGISDELMRSCTPMDYALLVPTIVQQSVEACNRNLLDIDTLKGGLEYFFQPFLLAPAVGALHWLAHHLWTLHDVDVPLQILQALVLPQSLSDEAVPIYKLVLRIGARPAITIVKELLRKAGQQPLPDTVDFVNIIDVLTPHLEFCKGL